MIHLVQIPPLRLRDETDDKAQSTDRYRRVQPERAVQAQHFLEVYESFDTDKSTSVAERGGESAAEASVLQGEQLRDEQPGYGADAHGEGYCEDEHAEERDPVVLGGHTVTVNVLVVGEGAEGGQGDGHEDATGDEQGESPHCVYKQAGQQRSEELHERNRYCTSVRVHPAECLPEDAHGVEVEGVGTRESGSLTK